MKLFILALVSANSAKFREPSGKHVKYRILNIYYTLSQKHFMTWDSTHKLLAIVLFKLPEMTGKIPRARMSVIILTDFWDYSHKNWHLLQKSCMLNQIFKKTQHNNFFLLPSSPLPVRAMARPLAAVIKLPRVGFTVYTLYRA